MRYNRFSNGMDASEMKHYLDLLSKKFNNRSFIPDDPVSIPHRFNERYDIEISGFLAATIAWGRRDLILRSANNLIEMMDNEPYRFITSASEKEIFRLKKFVHRTFNGEDAVTFIDCLRRIYLNYGSLENVLLEGSDASGSLKESLVHLHKTFFSVPHHAGSERHLSDVSKGSAGKKLNMFLRWMVRSDDCGVDFGIWKGISPSWLFIPLDLHAGNTARSLGLLTRKQNDWKAVEELTSVLRGFDPEDPVKYDFALFGAGVNKEM
jgi:uncharacterized protein (TIGR02757 family)